MNQRQKNEPAECTEKNLLCVHCAFVSSVVHIGRVTASPLQRIYFERVTASPLRQIYFGQDHTSPRPDGGTEGGRKYRSK